MTFSIITVVYNGVAHIAEAIASVLGQTGCQVEYIVIDGGSTDGTQAVIESFDTRIAHSVSEPDRGIYDAMNKGLALACGDVVGMLNADDLYAGPDVLAKVATAFEREPIDCCYGDLRYVSADLARVVRYWRSGPYSPASFARGWMPPHPTFFVRRSVYARCGGFDLRYRIASDYELMVRLLKHERLRCVYIPEVLVDMRIGGHSNRHAAAIWNKSREDFRILRQHGQGPLSALATLALKNTRKLPQLFTRP
jgi:glycosyltransferase involved in cell wall biosynthesis